MNLSLVYNKLTDCCVTPCLVVCLCGGMLVSESNHVVSFHLTPGSLLSFQLKAYPRLSSKPLGQWTSTFPLYAGRTSAPPVVHWLPLSTLSLFCLAEGATIACFFFFFLFSFKVFNSVYAALEINSFEQSRTAFSNLVTCFLAAF